MDVLQTSGTFMLQHSFSVKTALKSVYRIKSIQKSLRKFLQNCRKKYDFVYNCMSIYGLTEGSLCHSHSI